MRSSRQMRAVVATAGDARIDYIALVDPETLQPVGQVHGRTLAALAVWIENTRLIDNCLLEPPTLSAREEFKSPIFVDRKIGASLADSGSP